jgi:hypothetical protein
MLLKDLGQVRQFLLSSPVFSDKLWDRQASEVQPSDLTYFLARMTGHGLTKEAKQALDVLQTQAIHASIFDGLNSLPFLDFDFGGLDNRFAVDDLVTGLGAMTAVQGQATLLALELRFQPTQTSELMWSQVLRLPPSSITPLASEVIRARNALRHIRLPYVFWSYLDANVAAPLLDLRHVAEKAFGCTWEALAADYETILMIDSRAEAASFLEVARP